MKLSLFYLGFCTAALVNPFENWHQSDLQRWLSDHSIPYSGDSDKNTLTSLVREKWNKLYESVGDSDLIDQLSSIGLSKSDSREGMLDSIRNWHNEKLANGWNWVFESWTESDLKTFLDAHNIPNPGEKSKSSYIDAIQKNSALFKDKLTEIYPGDWIYNTWTDNRLREWLEARGLEISEERERMIAAIRKYSNELHEESVKKSAALERNAQSGLTSLYEAMVQSWSEDDMKQWCEEKGITLPKSTDREDLLRVIRKNLHRASSKAQHPFNSIIKSWSDSRLRAYLRHRGIEAKEFTRLQLEDSVIDASKKRLQDVGDWMIETLDESQLKELLEKGGRDISNLEEAGRKQLVQEAERMYSDASETAKQEYKEFLSSVAKANVFESWTVDELKDYLKSYGEYIPEIPEKSSLVEQAKQNFRYYVYGNGENDIWDYLGSSMNDLSGKIKQKANNMYKSVSDKYVSWRNEL